MHIPTPFLFTLKKIQIIRVHYTQEGNYCKYAFFEVAAPELQAAEEKNRPEQRYFPQNPKGPHRKRQLKQPKGLF